MTRTTRGLKNIKVQPQFCGSGVIESGSGSGSSISSESGSGYGSRVLMNKNLNKNSTDIFSFLYLIKNYNLLFLGLHKGRQNYKRSLQPSKKNIQHFKR
jgi:hypothetical protein